MKSIRRLSQVAAGNPLISDDLIEFHAARLLLLIAFCGTKNTSEGTIRIEGLTKLAKLDFFVRYPDFFNRASEALNTKERSVTTITESSMIRHHYGPWDQRYYEIIPFLEGCQLVEVRKNITKNSFDFYLTDLGINAVERFKQDSAFETLINQMKQVKKTLGSKTGTALKELIYKIFDEEVGRKPRGEVIQ
jgi:hypothetical protein